MVGAPGVDDAVGSGSDAGGVDEADDAEAAEEAVVEGIAVEDRLDIDEGVGV